MEKQILIWVLMVAVVCFGLTMLALIDIIRKDFGSAKAKLLWHFLALIPFIGWLLYLIFGFRRGKRHRA